MPKDEVDCETVGHRLDWSSIQIGYYHEHDGVIDINCRNCGKSGSFMILDTEVDWG